MDINNNYVMTTAKYDIGETFKIQIKQIDKG